MTDLTPPPVPPTVAMCQFHPETECLYRHKCFSLGCRNDPIEAEKRYPTPPVWLQQRADLPSPPMQPSANSISDDSDPLVDIALALTREIGHKASNGELGTAWPLVYHSLRDREAAARAALIAELREPGASVCEHLSEVCWQNNGWGIEVKVLLGALADLLEKRA